jgi:hypothetical protein
MHANRKPRRAPVVRKRCAKCRSWVLPGVLVAGECPACTGIQALPLTYPDGRPVRPQTCPDPAGDVLPGGVR